MIDEDDFIQWVIETQPDPWSTMANDYILFEKKDQVVFAELQRVLGDRFKKIQKPVNITNTPSILVVANSDGSELRLWSRTNYTFARLLQLCLEEAKQTHMTDIGFAEWLVRKGYYDTTPPIQ